MFDDPACLTFVNAWKMVIGTRISICRGTGHGAFQLASTITPQGLVEYGNMVAADVNRDGKPDLVVAAATMVGYTATASSLTAYLGNGDGTFSQGATEMEPDLVDEMVAADFRGTGTPDLIEEISSLSVYYSPPNGTGMTIRPEMAMDRSKLPRSYFLAAAGGHTDTGITSSILGRAVRWPVLK